MDLLCDAYSNDSDEEETEEKPKRQKNLSYSYTPSTPHTQTQQAPIPIPIPIPGTYVSKRQRASMGHLPASLPHPASAPSSFTRTGNRLVFSFSIFINHFIFIYLF